MLVLLRSLPKRKEKNVLFGKNRFHCILTMRVTGGTKNTDSMEDWAKRLDGFLEFNGNELLMGPGKVSAEQAKLHAETEFEKYHYCSGTIIYVRLR